MNNLADALQRVEDIHAERKRRADLYPDLVAALEEMADFYGEFSANGNRGMSYAAWQNKARNMTNTARAVLARAKEGERG